jgi:hypothetical protein
MPCRCSQRYFANSPWIVGPQDGESIYFKIKLTLTTPLSKLMDAYCARQV